MGDHAVSARIRLGCYCPISILDIDIPVVLLGGNRDVERSEDIVRLGDLWLICNRVHIMIRLESDSGNGGELSSGRSQVASPAEV